MACKTRTLAAVAPVELTAPTHQRERLDDDDKPKAAAEKVDRELDGPDAFLLLVVISPAHNPGQRPPSWSRRRTTLPSLPLPCTTPRSASSAVAVGEET